MTYNTKQAAQDTLNTYNATLIDWSFQIFQCLKFSLYSNFHHLPCLIVECKINQMIIQKKLQLFETKHANLRSCGS